MKTTTCHPHPKCRTTVFFCVSTIGLFLCNKICTVSPPSTKCSNSVTLPYLFCLRSSAHEKIPFACHCANVECVAVRVCHCQCCGVSGCSLSSCHSPGEVVFVCSPPLSRVCWLMWVVVAKSEHVPAFRDVRQFSLAFLLVFQCAEHS